MKQKKQSYVGSRKVLPFRPLIFFAAFCWIHVNGISKCFFTIPVKIYRKSLKRVTGNQHFPTLLRYFLQLFALLPCLAFSEANIKQIETQNPENQAAIIRQSIKETFSEGENSKPALLIMTFNRLSPELIRQELKVNGIHAPCWALSSPAPPEIKQSSLKKNAEMRLESQLTIFPISEKYGTFTTAMVNIFPDRASEKKEYLSAAEKAVRILLNKNSERPQLILASATSPGQEELLEAVRNVWPDLPVIGGSPSGTGFFPTMFNEKQSGHFGILLCAFYSSLTSGYSFSSGFPMDITTAKVLHVEKKRRLYTFSTNDLNEINACDFIKKQQKRNQFNNHLPLIGMLLEPDEDCLCMRSILYKCRRDTAGSPYIETMADLSSGDTVHFLKGTRSALRARPYYTLKKAIAQSQTPPKGIKLALLFNSQEFSLEKNSHTNQSPELHFPSGIKPITIYTRGEFAYYSDIGSFFGNMMCSALVLGEN